MQVLEDVTDAEAKVIPEGFPNSILWNAGHILVTTDIFINNKSLGQELAYPHLVEYFKAGSRPSEWDKEPITLSEVKNLLAEQLKDYEKKYEGKLNDKLREPVQIGPLAMETSPETFTFSTIHESLHNGIIKAMKNVLREK